MISSKLLAHVHAYIILKSIQNLYSNHKLKTRKSKQKYITKSTSNMYFKMVDYVYVFILIN